MGFTAVVVSEKTFHINGFWTPSHTKGEQLQGGSLLVRSGVMGPLLTGAPFHPI